MNLKYLTTVATINRLGSFQKAATYLNFAQSTITFQVQQVELELGGQLFIRDGRRIRLSPLGQRAMPIIKRMLTDETQLENIMQNAELAGKLTIGVPETMLTYKLQPILKQFKTLAPAVQLQMRVLNCYDIYAEMVSGQLDIALHYDVRNYPDTFATQQVAQYPLVLLGAPELASNPPDFIAAKQDLPLSEVMNDAHARYEELFGAYLAERGIHLQPPMELWSIETVKQSVASNLGVAFMPRFCAEAELAAGTLIELPTAMRNPQLDVIAARPLRSEANSPAANLFYELLTRKTFEPESQQ
jgi:DNA-binding transcriptional LysR family regulator